ncbi:MAG: Type 1 glutamine amidotransferase-like domain-containing protein [Patescibacteria group bacterium]
MKTKFILHGGFNSEKVNEDNSDFYKEILKDAPENSKVLLIPFAKDADRIPLATKKVSSEFIKNKWQKEITIEIATESDFINQIKLADVLYFHGGVSLKLLETLKKYPELKNLITGKIIAGESAGANVWCKYFYSPRAGQVFEGLGILPIKIIPHYKKEYTGKLNGVGQDLEELLLPEYTYKVLFK